MTKQNILIINFNSLYEILDEIKVNLSFNIVKHDNENDSRPLLDLIKWCENIIKKTRPDLILTHHRNCTNIDHVLPRCMDALC